MSSLFGLMSIMGHFGVLSGFGKIKQMAKNRRFIA